MSVSVPVDRLWDYFKEHQPELKNNLHLVAQQFDDLTDEEIDIYLTDEGGYPYFSVEVDGNCEYEAESISKTNAEETYAKVLSLYILEDFEPEGEEDFAPEDDDRIAEIYCATEDLLWVFLEEDPEKMGITECDIDDITFAIEEMLFDEFGISVRHPENIDGKIVQYPFDGQDFENIQE